MNISVLPVYPMHAKAMSLVPKGVSLYLFEVQLNVFSISVSFHLALLDVSGCGEVGEVSPQFATLPKSEKFIWGLLD